MGSKARLAKAKRRMRKSRTDAPPKCFASRKSDPHTAATAMSTLCCLLCFMIQSSHHRRQGLAVLLPQPVTHDRTALGTHERFADLLEFPADQVVMELLWNDETIFLDILNQLIEPGVAPSGQELRVQATQHSTVNRAGSAQRIGDFCIERRPPPHGQDNFGCPKL